MDIAVPMDDLPLWSQSAPPEGDTAAGIVADIRTALSRTGIDGVYASCNGWPLDRDPTLARGLDDWVADGPHVGNHTHCRVHLPDVTCEAVPVGIDLAETRQAPWTAHSPRRLFRHPRCHWARCPESWPHWTHIRRRAARAAGDRTAETRICDAFLGFAVVAQDYFEAHRAAGARFVPLDRAMMGGVQKATRSRAPSDFLVLRQKLARAAGTPIPRIAPDRQGSFARISRMGAGRTD